MKETLRALVARACPLGGWLWWISLGAVVFLSTAPGLGPPERLALDKIAHFSAYGWLALLTVLSLRGRTARWAGGGLLCTAFGTEAAQMLADGRTAMIGDAVANLAGLGAGTAMGLAVLRTLREKPGPSAEESGD